MIKTKIILIKLVNDCALCFLNFNISFNPLFYAFRLFCFDWLERRPDDVTCTTKHAKVTIRLIEN